MTQFTPMATVLREGSSGNVKVDFFGVSKEDASRSATRMVASNGREPAVGEGQYARLWVGGQVMMSDTQMERRSNYGVVLNAKGDVFIAGLGIGMVLVPILANPNVRSVTVVESSEHVIALVADQLKALPGGEKLTVIHSDVFEWKLPKGQMWDTIYFDIWPEICTTNLEQMTRLHRKFCRRKRPGGWMESWQRGLLQYRQRQERGY